MSSRRRLISTLLATAVAAGTLAAPRSATAQDQAGPQPQAQGDTPAGAPDPLAGEPQPPAAVAADDATQPGPATAGETARQEAGPAQPAGQRAGPDAAPAMAPVPDAVAERERLASVLRGPTARQAERDDAAARLVSRHSADADDVLGDVLAYGTPAAKVAVARALADDPNPPEAFIDPLANLLGGGEQRSVSQAEAAAQALASYRRNTVALGHLIQAATNVNQPPALRAPAARAMGRVADPASAEALVQLLNVPANEGREVRDAAAEALVEMTGLTENGRDPGRWSRWWQLSNAANNPDRWRADLLDTRAARYDRLRRRHEGLVAELRNRLRSQYQAAQTKEQRQAAMLDFLSSTEPDVRLIGADFIPVALADHEELSDAVRDRLVAMVGDSDTQVRLKAAETLKNVNYPGALGALLAQLGQERDERVKIAIAGAIVPIGNAAAVGPLLEALRGTPPPAVAVAAVRALGASVRDLRTSNPELARQVSDRLRALVGQRVRAAGGEDLRVAALDALAPLKDPTMLRLGRALLFNEASGPVRQATLRVLGELGDPQAADMVSDVLRAERRDPRMRALALEALGKTGGMVYAETFYNYMQPRNEPDPDVRDVAWQTLRAALARGTDQQLANTARLFKSDPDHHVFVAQAMADRFQKRNNLDEWAFQMRNVADDEMNLQPRRPADAAAHYEQALKYWVENNKDAQTAYELTQKVVQARLAAGQYAQAATFAQNAIGRQGPTAKEAVGSVIKNEADNLRTVGDFRSALALIDAALKMNPPLDPRHRGDLEKIRTDIEAAAPAGASPGGTAPRGAASGRTGNTAPGQ